MTCTDLYIREWPDPRLDSIFNNLIPILASVEYLPIWNPLTGFSLTPYRFIECRVVSQDTQLERDCHLTCSQCCGHLTQVLVSNYSFSMQSIQNLGLAVISQVAGTIVDLKGYLVLEVFFCAWLCSKYSLLHCLKFP